MDLPNALTVNGQPISEADVRAEMAALRAHQERSGQGLALEQRLQLREQAIDALVERTLILQEARRLQLAPAPQEVEKLASTLVPRVDGVAGCRAGTDPADVAKEAERRLAVDRLVDHCCRNVKPPKRTEIGDYYRAHQAELHRPETVHAAHLTKRGEGGDPAADRTLLAHLRERLLAGEEFAALACQYSDCPENGGDLGFFPRGVMVEEFDAVVFSAPLRQLTPVFETCFGLHVAMVHERRPAGVASLNEIFPEIEKALHRSKQDREVGRRLDALRGSARIEMPR